MSDRDALIAAILANPDEDTPRLMFADWLDEHGDAERAEFIRVQCELARQRAAEADFPNTAERDPNSYRYREWPVVWRPVDIRHRMGLIERESQLQREHGREWRAGLPKYANNESTRDAVRFRRGFVRHAQVSLGPLTKDPTALWRHDPVESILLAYSSSSDRKKIPKCAPLASLHELQTLDGDGNESALTPYAECPHLSGLRRLAIGHSIITDDGAQALAGSPYLRPAALELACHALSTKALAALLRGPFASQLRHFRPRYSRSRSLPVGGVEVIANAPLTALRRLDLCNCSIGDAEVWALTQSRSLSQLVTLDLDGNELTDVALESLAAWPGLASIRSLDLGYNGSITDDGVTALLKSPYFRPYYVGLTGARLGAAGAKALAAWPGLADLVGLDLSRTELSDAGAFAIVNSPHWRDLRYLQLWRCDAPNYKAMVARFRERFGTTADIHY